MTCLPPADDGKWVFPAGTVMVKNFMFQDMSRPSGYKLVETRLFVRLAKAEILQGVSTEWVGYGYQWDDAQTEATIIGNLMTGSDVGLSATFQVTPPMGAAQKSITWEYPSRLDCITCHTSIKTMTPITPTSGYTLGPETRQMNRTAAGDTINQIDKFAMMGLFETPPKQPYLAPLVPAYPGQSGSPPLTAPIDQLARSYLHANCSFCHRPDGEFGAFDVRYDTTFKATGICNEMPSAKQGDLGVPGALVFTPGMPAKSLISIRMHAPAPSPTDTTGRMPPMASVVVDMQATSVIDQWITSITACPM
jgi:hypothetical protein